MFLFFCFYLSYCIFYFPKEKRFFSCVDLGLANFRGLLRSVTLIYLHFIGFLYNVMRCLGNKLFQWKQTLLLESATSPCLQYDGFLYHIIRYLGNKLFPWKHTLLLLKLVTSPCLQYDGFLYHIIRCLGNKISPRKHSLLLVTEPLDPRGLLQRNIHTFRCKSV